MCELEEYRIMSLMKMILEQWRTKTFVDRHRKGNEKEFSIGKLVLVFQTSMGSMSGKLCFRCTGPYWITKEFKRSYQLGTLAVEIVVR